MPTEYPGQEYYVGAKIRLTIRLDEFGDPTRLKPAPKVLAKNVNGVQNQRGSLQYVPDLSAPPGTSRLLLSQGGATSAQLPTQQSSSPDGLTFAFTCIPISMEWDQNGIRTGDTMKVTLRLVDMPIDPRVVRAAAVEGFIGTVTPLNYSAGISGALQTQSDTSASPLNMIPDTYVDPSGQQRTNSRFQGWVDKWKCDWPDEGEPTITLECRDNVKMLLDIEMPVGGALDMTKPLDVAVAQFLTNFPALQGLSIQYIPAGQAPVLQKVLQGTAYRPNLGPHPAKAGGGAEHHTVWDYLDEVCGSIGHIIRVEGTTIIIQKVRTLTSGTPTTRSDDPFGKGRTLPGTGRQISYRQFIYGRNIKTMSIERDFAKPAANIECRCYDTEHKQLLVQRFPLPLDRIKYAIPGSAQPDQKWHVVYVSGISDKGVLLDVAQSYYEQLGRNELVTEIKTHNLASFGGGNLDPDILDMKAGDTFEMLVNRDDFYNILTNAEKQQSSTDQNAIFMKLLGFSDAFANAYAKAYTNAGFLSQFRMRKMKVSWSVDEGVGINITGVNYIEVRADKSQPGEADTGSAPAGASQSVSQ